MSSIDFSRIETDDDRAAIEAQHRRDEAQSYLQATDWYALRSVETGKAVPEDVLSKRGLARVLLSDGAVGKAARKPAKKLSGKKVQKPRQR